MAIKEVDFKGITEFKFLNIIPVIMQYENEFMLIFKNLINKIVVTREDIKCSIKLLKQKRLH